MKKSIKMRVLRLLFAFAAAILTILWIGALYGMEQSKEFASRYLYDGRKPSCCDYCRCVRQRCSGRTLHDARQNNAKDLRENGKFRYLVQKKKNIVFGVNEDVMYEAHRITLRPDDMLFLYTDGVTEAMDKNNNLYSEGRLEETLNHIDGSLSVQEIIAEVRKDIDAHTVGTEQSDDITMLGVKFLGKTDAL